MQSIKVLIFVSMLVFAAMPAFCQDDALSDKALTVSGIYGQINDLGHAILAAIPTDALPTAQSRADAAAMIKKAASKSDLEKTLRKAVDEKVNSTMLGIVIGFYDSKLGRKIAKIHEAALDPTTLKNIRESRKLLASLDQDRLTILRQMVSSEGQLDTTNNLLKTVVRGFVEGSLSASQDDRALTAKLIETLKIVDKFMKGSRVEETALMSYAYNYRNLSDKELEDLAAFYAGAPSKTFSKAVQSGIDSAVFQVSKSLGETATLRKDDKK